jgi:peptidoglycan/LPS O-acetylase OafA/YrhL
VTVAFGGLQIAIGIWASTFDESVVSNALTIAGFSSGILLGLFALGLFSRKISDASALASAIVGILILLAIQFVLPRWGWKIAFPWLAVIGAITTVLSGLFLSTLEKRFIDETYP